ncbi:MAG TPA: type II toxin-antitoxin system VapC family toxin [Rubrobacter sp.]
MQFWDTSAIMPLISREPLSEEMRRLPEEDAGMVVWWATRVECVSAISRRAREGSLGTESEASARGLLDDLSESWTEARPTTRLRALAEQVLTAHASRAAGALQLSSAVIWCGSQPRGRSFACLDGRLRTAASRSGFALLPNNIFWACGYSLLDLPRVRRRT